MPQLALSRVHELLDRIRRTRVLVVGDVMLDQFIWGRVSRISPEAPVPIVEFERESFMPGGAANVARNLTALGGRAELFGIVGQDANASQLRQILRAQRVGCRGVVSLPGFLTATKTRIVAQKQQVTRLDRESPRESPPAVTARLLRHIESALDSADAVSIGDYGKGVVTQALVDGLRERSRERGRWLSFDPKPIHTLNLRGLSLLTPNRKEAFELAHLADTDRRSDPLADAPLRRVADRLLQELQPALLLITLGESGMLLCQRDREPFHVPTVAQEVFDVSGAGDTVIASFTLAIAAGASPMEAAIFSNHAAGVVVGKVGTATATPAELLASFANHA
ncbi:MAG TPA: PfkB family carbohydrate kinase [Verrucomicrobiota bacterium]|nr:carbohydrate kinase [Verrucomicrobiales bacterium]HRI14132.1 PfkB family carbohydrate kinase [Verrucomicrobiota bacterium]